MLRGDPSAALAVAEPILADPDAPSIAKVRALGAATQAWALDGRPLTAAAAARESLARVGELGRQAPNVAGGQVVGLFLALWLAGRVDELRSFAEFLFETSLDREADDFRPLWAFFIGRAAIVAGEPRTGSAHLREAAALMRELDVGRVLPWCLGAQA